MWYIFNLWRKNKQVEIAAGIYTYIQWFRDELRCLLVCHLSTYSTYKNYNKYSLYLHHKVTNLSRAGMDMCIHMQTLDFSAPMSRINWHIRDHIVKRSTQWKLIVFLQQRTAFPQYPVPCNSNTILQIMTYTYIHLNITAQMIGLRWDQLYIGHPGLTQLLVPG